VRELWTGSGLRLGPTDRRAELERTRRRDPDLFLIAEQSGALVGAVLGRFDGRRAWVHHLAVKGPARQLGIGARLMIELEHRVARKGGAKLNLHVEPHNEAVCAFYERLGFGRRDVIFMDKWLRGPLAARSTAQRARPHRR
jgi:ribosomal protein S18 acetylase RimI-like enzyme